ncbi:MAG: hypothetical protein M1540_05880 [Candidatus Bathyarchaeota archaeon]|nr:hypothetical protein [Candidatus Bathyarchaeota archaeon]
MAANGKVQVQVEFEGESLNKVEALKKYYGVESDAELVRVLVNEKARQLNVGPVEAITNDS